MRICLKTEKNLGKRCQWLHQRQQFWAGLLASCDSVNMPSWGWFHSVSPVTLPFLWLPFIWGLHLFQPSSTVRWCFSWALILLLHRPLNPDTLWVSFHGWSNSGLFSLSYQIFCCLLYSLKDCNKPWKGQQGPALYCQQCELGYETVTMTATEMMPVLVSLDGQLNWMEKLLD